MSWSRRQTLSVRIDTFAPTRATFRDYFKACYGPTIAVYRNIAEDPERVAALDRDLDDLAERTLRHDGPGGTPAMEWEYLLLTARTVG